MASSTTTCLTLVLSVLESYLQVVASFPVELSPEQQQLEGEAELIHSDGDAGQAACWQQD